jgi:hypothetical protein
LSQVDAGGAETRVLDYGAGSGVLGAVPLIIALRALGHSHGVIGGASLNPNSPPPPLVLSGHAASLSPY